MTDAARPRIIAMCTALPYEQLLEDMGWAVATYDDGGRLQGMNAVMAEMLYSRPVQSLPSTLDALFGAEIGRRLLDDLQPAPRSRLAFAADIGVCRATLHQGAACSLLLIEPLGAEGEKAAVRELLGELVEHAPEAIGVACERKFALYANATARRMLNLDTPERVQATSITALHADGIGGMSIDDALRRARENGPLQVASTINSADRGQAYDIDQTIMVHSEPVLGRTFYSSISRDKSDRLKMEKEIQKSTDQLHYSEKLWNSLVEHNHNLVVVTDSAGIIQFSNSGFLKDDPAMLLGRNLFSLVPAPERAPLDALAVQVTSGSTDHGTIEAALCLPDGGQHRCLWLASRLQRKDGMPDITWIITDIGREHAIRQRALAAEKLVATGRMAARIAHEINNPLAGIKGAISLIKMDFPKDHANFTYVEMVEKEINRLTSIIRQMYGIFKPESQAFSPVSITLLLQECRLLMAPLADERGIHLTLGEIPEVMLSAAESHLREILYNLTRNAIEASFDHGCVMLSARTDDGCIHIAVDDDGKGLPVSDESIFEPFFTTKQTFQGAGLGLGLSVSRSLANAMGGHISLHPRQPRGTRAVLCLPLQNPAADPAGCMQAV
jgi:PAS domain S-box-containing protein